MVVCLDLGKSVHRLDGDESGVSAMTKRDKGKKRKKARSWKAWLNTRHFQYARVELFRTKKSAIFTSDDYKTVIPVTITERRKP